MSDLSVAIAVIVLLVTSAFWFVSRSLSGCACGTSQPVAVSPLSKLNELKATEPATATVTTPYAASASGPSANQR